MHHYRCWGLHTEKKKSEKIMCTQIKRFKSPLFFKINLKTILYNLRKFLWSIISILIFLVVWQTMAMTGIFPSYLFPSIPLVINAFRELTLGGFTAFTLWENIWASMQRVLLGFIIAMVTGVLLGILMGWYRKLDQLIDPIFEIFRPIPPIAWIPLAILWFGIGETSKIFIIWIGSFIPCLINAYTGVKTVDPILIKAAKTLGAKDKHIFREVVIPSSIPQIIGGLRIAIGSAWACVVAAELIAATKGLGFMLMIAREWIRADIMVCGMITIGIIGYFFDYCMKRLQIYVAPWLKRV